MSGAPARARLVSEMRERGTVRSDAVAAAFAEVPRELFIPGVLAEDGLEGVYRDDAFVTKRDRHGMPISSSSQPTIMALMLELLELRPGDRVLEVGAGTGYNAALIRRLVGRQGQVTTIDVDSEIADGARSALRRAGYRAQVVVGDGRSGWPDDAPYDRIIVTASADRLARAWLDQLRDGGRLAVPLRLDPDGASIQLIPVLVKRDRRLYSEGMTWGSFMALHSGDGGWRGPPDSLGAHRSVGGRQTSFATLNGPGVGRLSERAARDLLAALVAGNGVRRARGTTPMGAGQTPLLLVFLLLAIPAGRRVAPVSERRHGVGVVDPSSGSAAIVSVPSPWRSSRPEHADRVRWSLDAYGGDAAAIELEGLLEQWRQLEAAAGGAQPRLRLTAYGGGPELRVRFSWG